MSEQSQNGWVALHGRYASSHQLSYSWDGVFYADKATALSEGYKQADDTDDFNVGFVREGVLIWFGWYDTRLPGQHYADVAVQLGWSAPEASPLVRDIKDQIELRLRTGDVLVVDIASAALRSAAQHKPVWLSVGNESLWELSLEIERWCCSREGDVHVV